MSAPALAKLSALAVALVVVLAKPTPAFALFVVGPGNNGGTIPGGIVLGGFGGGTGGNNNQSASPIQRSTNTLSNPVNYWQYSQITGIKPTVGTVRIYNQFGTLANQNGAANSGFGSNGGGFGGFGLGGFGGGSTGGGGTNLPGQGASSGGDDPPAGVLLHVNYANMFFPNQTQLNQTNGGQVGGGGFGVPGFGGGYGGNFGKYQFGNGGSGL